MASKPRAKSGKPPIFLDDHLRDVARFARGVAETYRQQWVQLLDEDLAEAVAQALVLAAIAHDLGKATEGFQKALDRNGRWEFRHEVLSAALLLSGSRHEEDDALWLATTAVLTHHRAIADPQLCNDSGWLALPDPDMVREAREKFSSKTRELSAYWEWLRGFWNAEPELQDLPFPEKPDALPPPERLLSQLKEEQHGWSIPSERKALAVMLTRGWLMAADHAASAGITEFRASVPHPDLPTPRKFQENVGNHMGNAMLEAPTGSGKTQAAVRWALRNREGGERIFYILPHQASIEAMADTLEEWFGKENVAVLHARAVDYVFREHFERTGEYESAVTWAKQEAELNRLVHKPIKVTTPFQLLKWLFGIPRWEIGASEMLGGLFIFDEIHAYDAHVAALILEMVRFLKSLGGRFLFMSATFPDFLKDLLRDSVNGDVSEFTLSGEDKWERTFLSQARHRLRLHEARLEDFIPDIEQEVQQGKRVLVVANRVVQAQEIYQRLKNLLGVHLLHGRFTYRDRVEKEKQIIPAVKKRDPGVQVLVSTQVVEVSLDVSFDTIFTEIAPVDDLLQRFGRVNRYNEHSGSVEVHVACIYDEALKYVYDPERLEATRKCAPADDTALTMPVMSSWVKDVYQDGWTEKERKRFEDARHAFRSVLEALRPLDHLEEGRREFYGLFQSVEVLPQSLFEDYEKLMRAKHYFLANQLLVSIPLSTFVRLCKESRIIFREDGTRIADARYDPEIGLILQEVDVTTGIV